MKPAPAVSVPAPAPAPAAVLPAGQQAVRALCDPRACACGPAAARSPGEIRLTETRSQHVLRVIKQHGRVQRSRTRSLRLSAMRHISSHLLKLLELAFKITLRCYLGPRAITGNNVSRTIRGCGGIYIF